MNRSDMLGYDPTMNKVFAFLFEDDLRKLTLYANYFDDEQFAKAKQAISLYTSFWQSGTSVEELKSAFEINASVLFPDMTFEAEIFKVTKN